MQIKIDLLFLKGRTWATQMELYPVINIPDLKIKLEGSNAIQTVQPKTL